MIEVHRERLIEKIGNTHDFSLLLVCAPAGFGKTTLLRQWASIHDDVEVVWIEDHSVLCTAERFLAALAPSGVAPPRRDAGRRSQESLAPGDFPRRLNETLRSILGRKKRYLIVVDDIDAESLAAFTPMLQSTIADSNVPITFAISSETALDVDFNRERFSGLVRDVKGANLQFALEELGSLYRHATDVELEDLQARTEGFPAVLGLVSLWHDRHDDERVRVCDFDLHDSFVLQYFENHILNLLAADELELLMAVSVTDGFDVDLAIRLSGLAAAASLLRGLLRLSPLLQRSSRNAAPYRVHPLLREVLLERLSIESPPQLARVHVLAGEHFRERRDTLRAMSHFCAAGHFRDAAKTLVDIGGATRLWVREGIDALRRGLRMLPQEFIDEFPRLQLAQIVVCMKDGSLTQAGRRLDVFKARTRASWADEDTEEAASLRLDIEVAEILLSVYMGEGGGGDILERCQSAMEHIQTDPVTVSVYLQCIRCLVLIQRGEAGAAESATRAAELLCRQENNLYNLAFVNMYRGNVAFMTARLDKARYHYRKSLHLLRHSLPNEHEVAAMVNVFLAETYYEQNNLALAASRLRGALEAVGRSEGWLDIYAAAYRMACGIELQATGVESALDVLAHARLMARERNLSELQVLVLALQVNCLLTDGQFERAHEVALSDGLLSPSHELTEACRHCWRICDAVDLAVARLEASLGRFDAALDVLFRAIERCRQKRLVASRLRLEVELSAVLFAAGKRTESAAIGRKVAPIIEVERFIRPLLELTGEPKAYLGFMNGNVTCGNVYGKAADLLQDTMIEQQGQGLLNKREIEIVHRLACGESNKQIARRLCLSENTIKFHLKRVYAKLGVRNRKEAVIECKQRGIATSS